MKPAQPVTSARRHSRASAAATMPLGALGPVGHLALERVRRAAEHRGGQVPVERGRPRAVAGEQVVEHAVERRVVAVAPAHHVGRVASRGRARAPRGTARRSRRRVMPAGREQQLVGVEVAVRGHERQPAGQRVGERAAAARRAAGAARAAPRRSRPPCAARRRAGAPAARRAGPAARRAGARPPARRPRAAASARASGGAPRDAPLHGQPQLGQRRDERGRAQRRGGRAAQAGQRGREVRARCRRP